ncbi:uncharacterized protein MELLADRAFT_115020 [Melampsora larici-populina 98AG31]|uniref:Uncharacterized protein n=1 Tax=Melampsora larici-populina (strain 98AG31 / pathotype 3-4-7) TaxID=747676 RepID=F4R6F3_MELLP|nr:uncharacterized protein MELLADRAFT_115020 [Melampsora larici-populina 98AG31]EGG11867.1 hypothetical protein MELLADRAFT_115020 [Melampsora larici-populina 98AG31]
MTDILMIHPTDWYSFHHDMYQDFHDQIESLYEVQEAKTIDESLASLDAHPKPKVVLLVHGEICDKEHSMVIKKVSTFAKQGGTVIMCFNFASFLPFPTTKWIFQKHLGLTWELGAYTRQDFKINKIFKNVFKIPLDTNYNVKALNITKVSEHCQIYTVTGAVKHESSVIFERYTDTGFIGYIGDVNNQTGSQTVLLAMLDKAININIPRTHPKHSKGKAKKVPIKAEIESQDDQAGQSTSLQGRMSQLTISATQPTQTKSSHVNKRRERRKLGAQNAQSSQPIDPQVNRSQSTAPAT